MSEFSLSSVHSSLKRVKRHRDCCWRTCTFDLTFETMHILLLSKAKLLKMFLRYGNSRASCPRGDGKASVVRTFLSMRVGMLGVCNTLLASIKRYFLVADCGLPSVKMSSDGSLKDY